MLTIEEIEDITNRLQSDDPKVVEAAMEVARFEKVHAAQELVKLLAALEGMQHYVVENHTKACEENAQHYAENWATVGVDYEKNMRHKKNIRCAAKEAHEHFRVARMEMVFVD